MRPYFGCVSHPNEQMTELIRTRNTPLEQAWHNSPCNVLYELCKARPGKNIEIEVGGAVFALVQNAQTARTILRNKEGRYERYFGRYADLFGASRLTVEDEGWRPLRDLSQPHIVGTDPDQLAAITQRQFNAVTQELAGHGDGSPILIDEIVDLAAASVISEAVLGFPIAEWGAETIEDIRKILRLAAWENFPVIGMSAVEQSFLTLDAEDAKTALQLRFQNMMASRNSSETPSLIDTLPEADPHTVDHFGEICTLLFAGFDTTASAITWAMFLLSNDPSLQARLRRQVAGFADSPNIKSDDVLALTDLSAFLLEALRIFPPIPVLSRIAKKDDEIGGFRVKANSRVLISIIGIQHDPGIFANPFTVQIDRHPRGDLAREAAQSFLPFGDGKRICPGAKIANLEALTALAVMLDKLRFDPVPARSVDLRWEASMRQAGGTNLYVSRVPS